MDYEKFQSFGQMPLTPDVLILPSELRYFVKVRKNIQKAKAKKNLAVVTILAGISVPIVTSQCLYFFKHW